MRQFASVRVFEPRRVHQQSLECSALDSCTHAHEDLCAHAKLARCFHPARARHAGDDPAHPNSEEPEQELQLQEQTTEKQEKQARLQKDLERGNMFSNVRIY